MITYLVAPKDLAIQAYMAPTNVNHVGMATRSFTDACNDPNHEFHRHAADFELYVLAEYDDTTGTFYTDGYPRLITRGSDVKQLKA